MVNKSPSVARVNIAGELVGALSIDKGICSFQYADGWLNKGIEISPIHLPLNDKIYSFPRLNTETYKGLPGAFADTLPDDFGNAVIDAWLARQGRTKENFTALDRLLYTGNRGMGALEYAPGYGTDKGKLSTPLEIQSLMEMAQTVLDQRAGIELAFEQDKEAALTEMMQVGTSAGGARAKAVIGINQNRTEIRSGQVALPQGFEHWLLKFDGVSESLSSKETFGDPKGYGRMEYAYYLMALDAGIEMQPCELLHDGDRAHFMTKRFDRDHNKKFHYQSLCAMAHADYKIPGGYSYEQLFSLMRQLALPRSQAVQMFRRMVFNIVSRNNDDHTKNFGFMLNHDNDWIIAPAFDIAYSYRPDSYWVSQSQLTLNGKRDDFNINDLMIIGKLFQKEASLVIEQVVDSVSKWNYFAKEAGVFTHFQTTIGKHHRLDI
ncbi:HipA-like protein [Shewanella psychrophila]|uniref:HipA-like protein n=1 Tax=Shewanella psychrophila TaxID=225848 RepID=A0A1S6HKL6_9GAMM|nr:type II toxin-antitoxin system HipA family toxin [Shewanella psychrophila]AQS36052.1 HipA-like protein [Shewanella psychrophila]